jgi:hypothetical protein
MGRVQIINESDIPASKLERIVKFYKLRNLPEVSLHIRHSKECYYAYFLKEESKIVIGVGSGNHFPTKINRKEADKQNGYASGFYLFSQEEALVYLIGHELRHSWQKGNRYAKRKGRFKGVYSEADAEIFAIQKLNKWREAKCLALLK